MSNKNDSKTKAFGTVKNNKGFKSSKSRQKLVIAIFVVIVLILAVLATFIIAKVIDKLNTEQPPVVPQIPDNTTTKPYGNDDVHVGNLLVVDKTHSFRYDLYDWDNITSEDVKNQSKLPTDLINVWTFKNNPANNAETKITVGDKTFPTYELGSLATSIVLEETAFHAFNKMILDYCGTLDLSNHEEGSASGLNISWGWSNSTELLEDLKTSPAFYDHATGLTLNLRYSGVTPDPIMESDLKSDFKWIYDNAHKYGFIIRFPDSCGCDRDFDEANTSVRMRYVGYEHAYYIKTNGICLEEYIALLRDHHKASGTHLTFTADNGKSYEVYYVSYSGEPTSVLVPKNEEYYVSGDNLNSGFIVTVTK